MVFTTRLERVTDAVEQLFYDSIEERDKASGAQKGVLRKATKKIDKAFSLLIETERLLEETCLTTGSTK